MNHRRVINRPPWTQSSNYFGELFLKLQQHRFDFLAKAGFAFMQRIPKSTVGEEVFNRFSER